MLDSITMHKIKDHT